jgi:decaprenyl-phosphate phosphoribosyltransferase
MSNTPKSSALPDARPTLWSQIVPYIQIARVDHWFKNVFMLAGVMLAAFYSPQELNEFSFVTLAIALFATCLVASSNYVINEVLDAPTDVEHPVKRHRPIPSGRVQLPLAYAEWAALAVVGMALGWTINLPFLAMLAMLWFMGLLYNVPPVRLKDVPYLDVLTESVNNPLRLLLGWFVITPNVLPPVSLLASYWMVGAFFMASKRFAEYRMINDARVAGGYRKSFRHYNADRLLVSMMLYATASTLMLGVFIIRHKVELLLATPFFAGLFSYYLYVSLKEDSPVQNPERLYRERGLMIYLAVCLGLFVLLMFVNIPALRSVFDVKESVVPALWTVGAEP